MNVLSGKKDNVSEKRNVYMVVYVVSHTTFVAIGLQM